MPMLSGKPFLVSVSRVSLKAKVSVPESYGIVPFTPVTSQTVSVTSNEPGPSIGVFVSKALVDAISFLSFGYMGVAKCAYFVVWCPPWVGMCVVYSGLWVLWSPFAWGYFNGRFISLFVPQGLFCV